MKGTNGIQEETEVSGIKAKTVHCPFSKPSIHKPQSWQAGVISETPSTWLTLFDLHWRSPETPTHPTYEPTQADFLYEWLVLAHASHLPKSSQTSNSWLQRGLAAARLDSQLVFAWESPSSAQVAAISDCFIAHAGWS